MAMGPYPSDGFFGSETFRKFDAVLAMYHDQGLIPFKALAFESGVNFTAGLSVVRTSPAHGTAYDLVNKNEASPESFLNALFMACDVFQKRKEFSELSANPLEVQNHNNV
jgi:4-hydroxythreonine-4-phosphate dehydrogenase